MLRNGSPRTWTEGRRAGRETASDPVGDGRSAGKRRVLDALYGSQAVDPTANGYRIKKRTRSVRVSVLADTSGSES